VQGFRIHSRVWRRKFEKLRAGLSLRGDQLVVLFGGEIQQDATVTDLDSLVETGSVMPSIIAPPRMASDTTLSLER
jgi:hypothetical protein